MADVEATSAGSIVGYLSLDDSDWNEKLDAAQARADELGKSNPNIRISVDDASAIAKLAELDAQLDSMGGKNVNVRTSTVSIASPSSSGGGSAASTDAITAAEARLAAAQQAVISSSGRAQLAQMRLDDVLDKRGATDYQVAAAEFALQEATTRESASIDKAVAANQELIATREKLAEPEVVPPQIGGGSNTPTEAAKPSSSGSSDNGSGSLGYYGLIIAAIGVLLPMTAQLAGYVAGVGSAFGGMGAAAVLGVLGAEQAMKEADETGLQYSADIKAVKSDLDSLESTAAIGMLTGFNQLVGEVNSDLPTLNNEIGDLTQGLVAAGGSAIQGVIGGLNVMNPLVQEGVGYVESLAAGFDKWTSDGGLETFTEDAEKSLPVVASALGSAASGAISFLGALSPLGTVMFDVVDDAGKLLGFLGSLGPILPVVAGGALAAYAAFKGWDALTGISVVRDGIVALLPLMGTDLELTSTLVAAMWDEEGVLEALAIAEAEEAAAAEAGAIATDSLATATDLLTGPVGLVMAGLGALAAVIGISAAATQQGTAATTDYTSALQADNDAIGTHVTLLAAQQIQQSGVMSTASSLGISLTQMTQAITGSGTAYQDVSQRITAAEDALKAHAAAQSTDARDANAVNVALQKQLDPLEKLSAALNDNRSKLEDQQKAQVSANQAASGADGALATAKQSVDGLAESYSTLATKESNAETAAQNYESYLQSQNNDALKLAQSNATLQGDFNTLGSTVTSNLQSMNKAQATSLDVTTAAGLQNHNNVLQAISDAEAQASAVYQSDIAQGKSKSQATIDSNNDLQSQMTQLGKYATSAGLSQTAVQSLIDQVLNLKSIANQTYTLTLDVNTAQVQAKVAATLAEIDQLQGAAAGTQATAAATQRVVAAAQAAQNLGHAQGGFAGVPHLAGGGEPDGFVTGPGSSFADMVSTMLSPTEFVVKSQSANAIPGFLPAYNQDPTKTLGSVFGAGMAAASQRQPVFNVYVTSNGVDLSKYIDVKIESADQANYVSTGVAGY